MAAGIHTDHECSEVSEAKEKIKKGQWIMIRQGSAAKNLEKLLPLFEAPFYQRSLLATDDRNPADIIDEGHIDNIVRLAIKAGKDPVRVIKMATLNAANCHNLQFVGAIAPGYDADILVLDDLNEIKIKDVYSLGKKVVDNQSVLSFDIPEAQDMVNGSVMNSFHMKDVSADDFRIEASDKKCRVIKVIPGEI